MTESIWIYNTIRLAFHDTDVRLVRLFFVALFLIVPKPNVVTVIADSDQGPWVKAVGSTGGPQ